MPNYRERMSRVFWPLIGYYTVAAIPLAIFALNHQRIGIAICAPAITALGLLNVTVRIQASRSHFRLTDSGFELHNGLARTVQLRRSAITSTRWIDALGGLNGTTPTSAIQILDARGRSYVTLTSGRWDIEDLQDLRDRLDVPVENVPQATRVGRQHAPGTAAWTLTYTSVALVVIGASALLALLIPTDHGQTLNPLDGPSIVQGP